MEDLPQQLAVQGGVLPLVVGLVLAAALARLRLSGLAAVGGFLTAAYLIGSFSFWPLTAMRKLLLLAILAPALGILVDLAFRPTQAAGPLLGALFGLASVWVFWSVLAQRPLGEALAMGSGVAAFIFWIVAFTLPLHADALRVGSTGLALGLGTGIGAIVGASAVLGLLGIALAAGTGGFLVVAMFLGKRLAGGTILALSVSVIAALIGAAALVLAEAPWWSLPLLALVPLAARLPIPARAPAWLRAIVVSLYTLPVGAAYCLLAWKFST